MTGWPFRRPVCRTVKPRPFLGGPEVQRELYEAHEPGLTATTVELSVASLFKGIRIRSDGLNQEHV